MIYALGIGSNSNSRFGNKLNTLKFVPANEAMIAPTIITEDIALVTDIKGVCNEGVTLHTT